MEGGFTHWSKMTASVPCIMYMASISSDKQNDKNSRSMFSLCRSTFSRISLQTLQLSRPLPGVAQKPTLKAQITSNKSNLQSGRCVDADARTETRPCQRARFAATSLRVEDVASHAHRKGQTVAVAGAGVPSLNAVAGFLQTALAIAGLETPLLVAWTRCEGKTLGDALAVDIVEPGVSSAAAGSQRALLHAFAGSGVLHVVGRAALLLALAAAGPVIPVELRGAQTQHGASAAAGGVVSPDFERVGVFAVAVEGALAPAGVPVVVGVSCVLALVAASFVLGQGVDHGHRRGKVVVVDHHFNFVAPAYQVRSGKNHLVSVGVRSQPGTDQLAVELNEKRTRACNVENNVVLGAVRRECDRVGRQPPQRTNDSVGRRSHPLSSASQSVSVQEVPV